MKRRVVFVLLGGLILGLGGGGVYLYSAKQTAKKSPETSAVAPTPTPAQKMLSWDDPAGFTLSYSEKLTLNKHDEDKQNYAHLEFTDPLHPGRLIVWVTDFPKGVTDTASWAKKTATGSAVTFDTTLGQKPAQKILFSKPSKSVKVGSVFDGVLWVVETDLSDEPYWQSTMDTIVTSFAFKPLPTEPVSGGGGESSEGAPFDEEETIE